MKVSVGIPFFNSERTLPDAIRSVFAQTFQDWELILADDGSTDASLEIANAVSDARVRVYSDGRNRGLPYRLNQIARLAEGNFIARMDADDIMHPDRLSLQMDYLQANPAVDAVGTGTYTMDVECNPLGIRSLGIIDAAPESVIGGGLLLHPTVTARAEWFRRNPYDETFLGSEDLELWCRTYDRGSFGKLLKPLHFYRENGRTPLGYLKHYLRALRYERKLLSMYGPLMVGRRRIPALVMRTYLKGCAYSIATALGAQRSIVNQRSSPLTPRQAEDAREVLRSVLRTPVSGLFDANVIAGGSS
jgi:glycosyltransferase involved in cell wall biosynthesis